jgi:hypothetical protein
MVETRTVTLVDIPLVRRLSERGTILNSELGLTRDARGDNSALLSSILFARELHTLVARNGEHQVIGQFRYRQDEPNAHIVYLAPDLRADYEDTAWLHILDAMTREAGRYGAHTLVAEVEENSLLFETMRAAGFAVYSRQVIWRHDPYPRQDNVAVRLTEEAPGDHIGVISLICSTIPTMIQQVAAPNGDGTGWVYRKNGRIEGYIVVSEGKEGVYLVPYLHPDIMPEAVDVLEAAIVNTSRTQKVPVYIGVRAYQSWLNTSLERLGFEPWVRQAVMVRHIAAGIRYSNFARVEARWEGARSPIPPPSSQVADESQIANLVS